MHNTTKKQLEMILQQIKELDGIYSRAVKRFGISENEFWIWYTLIVMDGEHTQQDIYSEWSLSKQTVNTIVSNMVRKNFAVLEVIPGTKNRKNIRLTESGREYGENIIMPVYEAEQKAIAQLNLQDLSACTALLGKFIKNLKEEIHDTE